jgi:hypothetical protein
MFIKHLIGPRKGEVEEVIFDRARAKVLSGEAEDVYNQLGIAPKPVSVASTEPEIEVREFSRSDISSTFLVPGKKKQRR